MKEPLFVYDEFQKKAIETVDLEKSLLVSAPTGAGKTVIAEYAITRSLERGESVIYTAPVKALSNQKYRDFRAQYGDKIGILTGDVSINPDAPILIMTTEIYRNTLFEDRGRLENVKWIIFDEVHYLDDWERGTVWEESIMFSPAEINLLCLSATVPNIEEVADWIRTILARPIEVIIETHRPVPLVHLHQCQGNILNNFEKLRKEGYRNSSHWMRGRSARSRYGRRSHHDEERAAPNRIDKLVTHLKNEDRLPAIYFAFGRRRTEQLAQELPHFDLLDEREHKEVTALYRQLCEQFDLMSEISAHDMRPLVERGIAFHHAGMLPTLKEVVERLFTSKLLKLIFTTETFALGINMPARSVIFDELRKFYGTHFANLKTRDFYQMAGRAGRRGMDEKGFVYSRINPHHIELHEVQRMITGKPEPIRSQFNATYATILNLYKRYGERLLEIYPRSLHHFQNSTKSREKGLGSLERKWQLLQTMNYISAEGLTPKGEFASCLYGYELLLAEMHEGGFFDTLDPHQLNVVLMALIYEPRRADQDHPTPKRFRDIAKTMLHYLHEIHKTELKFQIRPLSKEPKFQLSSDVESWSRGASFQNVMKTSFADEGEMIRYFRMVIQLLRELRNAPNARASLKEKAREAIRFINRDIVDAEKQLRA